MTPEQKKELLNLLLTDPQGLSDTDLERLLEAKDDLYSFLYSLQTRLINHLSQVREYRRKKTAFSKQSTDQLQRRYNEINRGISRIVCEEDSDYDPLPDSFFETRLDSDEHVIGDIIKEREAQVS